MNNLTSDTLDLIQDILPALDELIALMEYYDSPTYKTVVQHIADSLSKRGLVAYDDRLQPYDETKHEVHDTFPTAGIDEPVVRYTHLRGYAVQGIILRKSVVDLNIPET